MEKRVPAPSSPGDAGASEKCSPEGAAALSTLRIPTTRCELTASAQTQPDKAWRGSEARRQVAGGQAWEDSLPLGMGSPEVMVLPQDHFTAPQCLSPWDPLCCS
ncbi:hypothetical protein Celaphus_00004052 [Cervus elaphus hippelaphus]|uniref:Uncharacterized protein n=1 Tax=Cervus elaphus hippelaphus TaxID=46360 RepID=A0A212DBT8_CEREH|nr:hypothetical protein Celaphus_00004052 [Cervus elaphus hippelaphus]